MRTSASTAARVIACRAGLLVLWSIGAPSCGDDGAPGVAGDTPDAPGGGRADATRLEEPGGDAVAPWDAGASPEDGVDLADTPETAGDAQRAGNAGETGPAMSGWEAPFGPDCPGSVEGSGLVWLDDPADLSLASRPLYCLDGTGSLRGAFVASIAGDSWAPAYSAAHVYDFPADDLRQREVQAYYGIVAMAARFQPYWREPVEPVEVELLASDHMATAWYHRNGFRIEMGLCGTSHGMLHARITNHEYAHHLAMTHYAHLPETVNEAVADYLAADLRDHPVVLALSDMSLSQELTGNPMLADLAALYFERSLENGYVYPTDAVPWSELCAVLKLAAQVTEEGAELIPKDRLKKCDEMTEEELAMPEPHLTGRIVGGALWDARAVLGPHVIADVLFQALHAEVGADAITSFGPGLAQVALELHGQGAAGGIWEAFAARGLAPPD